MRHGIICGLLLSASVVSSVWAAEPTAVSVTALQVKKKTPESLDVNLMGNEGVQFVVVFSQPDRYIVGVDEEASKLISAKDDKGTDLAEDQSEKWVSSFFSKINNTGHKVAIPVTLSSLPAAGATTIQVKGEIVLKCGSEEKTETVKPFELAKGTTVQCGTHTLKVEAGKKNLLGMMFGGGDEDKNQQLLSITVEEGGHWLKKYEFVDEQGNVIKSKDHGSSSSNETVSYQVGLSSDVKTAGLRITYFQKVEDVKQPIDVKLGVGLP